jgi:molybdate transport system substrate-binding protein
VKGTRYTYAFGRLVLYSKTPGLVDAKGAVLTSDKFAKLAIADPTAAPYGQAAVETLQKLKVYDAVAPKIVKGSSITQAYQYVATGNAELGFVAQSQVINEPGGSRWLVPAADHAPIEQQAVLLKTGEKNPAARAFLVFLRSPAAIAIIRRYGYEVRR